MSKSTQTIRIVIILLVLLATGKYIVNHLENQRRQELKDRADKLNLMIEETVIEIDESSDEKD